MEGKRIKFMLDGCDISFIATAPEDITLKDLLKQCDRIVPDYCACGIRNLDKNEEDYPAELAIEFDDIYKLDDVACTILTNGENKMEYTKI